MKKILLVALAVLWLNTNLVVAQDKVTNQSVIEMTEQGLDAEIIISFIANSDVDFDISPATLSALKEKGVPSAVIAEMIKVSRAQKQAEASKTGLYFIDKEGNEKRILPSVFSGTKTNTVAAAFSGGMANANIKSTVTNASSSNIVSTTNQVFYFYFMPSQGDALSNTGGAGDWWFKQATSPNEFALVELDTNKKKNERTLKTGKVNAWGAKLGVNSGDAIPFEVEQLTETSFKISLKTPLQPGEYCFFYQGTIPQGGFNNQSIFDFSVQ